MANGCAMLLELATLLITPEEWKQIKTYNNLKAGQLWWHTVSTVIVRETEEVFRGVSGLERFEVIRDWQAVHRVLRIQQCSDALVLQNGNGEVASVGVDFATRHLALSRSWILAERLVGSYFYKPHQWQRLKDDLIASLKSIPENAI